MKFHMTLNLVASLLIALAFADGYISFDGYCLDASGNTFERTCGPSESAAACKSSCDDSADCGAAESASNGDWCCLISETDSRLIASGDGFANSRCYVKRCDLSVKNDRVWYAPLDLPGELRTVNTAEECRQRCANTPSCFYFNFFPSLGCRLVGKDATLTSVPRNSRLASGAVRCEHRIFSQKAAPGQCLSSENSDIGLALGNTPHTIQVRLTFPESAPSGNARQWILNLGRSNTGDHHWIWNSNTRVQFGKWNGAQIQAAAINECTELTTTSSRGVLKLYCNRRLLAEENTAFSIESSQLSIGRSPPIAAGSDFAGCISEVKIWAYEKSAGEILNLEWEDVGNGVCVDEDFHTYMRVGLFGEQHGFSGTKESCKQLCATYKWCVGINFINGLNLCYLNSGRGDGLPIAELSGFLDVWGTGTGPIARVAVPYGAAPYDNDWECHRIANFDLRWLD